MMILEESTHGMNADKVREILEQRHGFKYEKSRIECYLTIHNIYVV